MATKARIWKSNGKSVDAKDVYSKIPFYCNTDNCDAVMYIVSMGEESAHFKSKSRAEHKFPICIRNDIIFNTDKYNKDLFSLQCFKNKVLGATNGLNIHSGSGGGGTIGTGSKIPPYTLKSIYAAYVASLSSGEDTIGDCKYSEFMRCKENYIDFINNPNGFYVVEMTYYHKVQGEYAIIFNVPMYDVKTHNYHVKVNFTNHKDFSRVYNHHKKLKKSYLSIMLVAAEWLPVIGRLDYIAECTITKSTQHTYIE